MLACRGGCPRDAVTKKARDKDVVQAQLGTVRPQRTECDVTGGHPTILGALRRRSDPAPLNFQAALAKLSTRRSAEHAPISRSPTESTFAYSACAFHYLVTPYPSAIEPRAATQASSWPRTQRRDRCDHKADRYARARRSVFLSAYPRPSSKDTGFGHP